MPLVQFASPWGKSKDWTGSDEKGERRTDRIGHIVLLLRYLYLDLHMDFYAIHIVV